MKIVKILTLLLVITAASGALAQFYPFDNPDPQSDFEQMKSLDMKSLSPEELTRLGWYYHVFENANDKAAELFQEAILKSPGEVWALYGMTALNKSEADFKTQARYVLMLCAAAPEHPLAEVAYNNLRQLIGAIDGVAKPAQTILDAQINGNSIKNPFAMNLAASVLLSIHSLNGDQKAFDAVNRRMNYIRDWRLAGPFGQFENLAFFTMLPPESEPSLGDKYTFDGEEIVTKEYKSESGRIDAYFMESGVYIAETYIRAKEAQTVLLFISSGKSIKCYLNGAKCCEKDLIREYGGATETISVQLQKGWNRLVVKFVAYSGSNILVEILSPDCTVPNVEISSKPRKVEPVQNAICEKIQSAGVKYFSERMQANPKDPVAPVMLGLCRSLTGDIEQTKEDLYRAVEIAPDYAYANYLLAQALERDGTQPQDSARGEAKKYYERAIKLAGEYPSALSALASYKADEKNETEAIGMLKDTVKQSPSYYLWHKKLYDLYSAKGWEKERFDELQAITSMLKESSVPATMQRDYYYTRKMFPDYVQAVLSLQKSSLKGKYLAQYYRNLGDAKKAIAEYERLKKWYPYDSEIYGVLADLYESQGRIAAAQKQAEKLHSFYPKDVSIMLRLAQLYSLGDNDRKASEIYSAILEQDPLNVTAQKALELAGEKDFFEKYEIDAWKYINDKDLREKYKDFSTVVVIDQTVERVFAKGSSQSMVHELMLVNNKQGIEQAGEVEVPQNCEFIELRTIKPDGTIIEPEIVPGKKTISMTGIAEGDFIDKKYILRAPSPFGNRKAYLGQRFYFRIQSRPMVISQYIVAVPADIALQFELLNMSDQPETWTEDGTSFFKWERREIPEIKPELYAVTDYEYVPNVHGGYNLDPELQTKITADSNFSATKASREVSLKAVELITGKSSQAEKVRAIYDYVIGEINGGIGNPMLSGNAGFILADRNGDRLCLMKAMLDSIGIPSNVIMVMNNTVKKSDIFPGFYPYPILAVRLAEGAEMQFLDLNVRYNAYGFFPPQYQGAAAKILADYSANGASAASLPLESIEDWDKLAAPITTPVLPREANGTLVEIELTVAKDGSITGMLIDSYAGTNAAAIRGSLEKIEEFDLRNNLERGLNANFRGAKLKEYKITAQKETDKPLGIIYDFTAAKYATVSNGTLTFAQGFYPLNLGKTYVRIPKRETPMGLYQAYNYEHRVTVKLPEGSVVTEMPQSFSLNTKYGTYTLETKADDGVFTFNRKYYAPIQKIAPEDYQGFVDFCRAIDKNEEKDIKVVLPAEPKEEEKAPAEGTDEGGSADEKKKEQAPETEKKDTAPSSDKAVDEKDPAGKE